MNTVCNPTQNNNEQQNNAASNLSLGYFSQEMFPPINRDCKPIMLALFRQSLKVRFEKLAFDAQEPHETCYEQSTALESNDILQQIKGRLVSLNEETCFLLNELTLLEHLQKLT